MHTTTNRTAVIRVSVPKCHATLVALVILAVASSASATTIATWTFETSVPTTAGPFSPEVGAGSAIGSHVSSATVYSSPSGNGSFHSFSSTNWGVGDYYQFQVNTTGLENIMFSWDQTSSNTGPRDFQLQYSTNGSSFTNFGAVYSVLANASPNPFWNATTSSSLYSFTRDLSSVTALNNTATVYFRLTMADTTSANGGTVGTLGTDRVDNVSVSGVRVPEPGSVVLASLGIVALSLAAMRCRSVC